MEFNTIFNTILNVVTLTVVSVGGYLVYIAKVGFEARVKTSVEESVKLGIKNANWIVELAQELEKVRGTERQELRFKSYNCLWKELRPLAIYASEQLDQSSARALSRKLTDWYFSENGGLMLTTPVRELYFTLQDLLQAITHASVDAWVACPDPDATGVLEPNPKGIFEELHLTNASRTLTYFDGKDPNVPLAAWPRGAESLASGWREDLKSLPKGWSKLNPAQRFALLQRAGSILRTGMTCDVESRLR